MQRDRDVLYSLCVMTFWKEFVAILDTQKKKEKKKKR